MMTLAIWWFIGFDLLVLYFIREAKKARGL